MLLQSHEREIELLPALPSAWPSGAVSGLRARGGYEVGIRWRDGRLTEAVIRADHDGACRARLGREVRTMPVKAGEWLRLDGNLNRRPKQAPRENAAEVVA
jgi:alpha-L-fucosidase 2